MLRDSLSDPFVVLGTAALASYLFVLGRHYGEPLKWLVRRLMMDFPLIGLAQRIARDPACTRLHNKGVPRPVTHGEASLLASVIDCLESRLTTSAWQQATTFLARVGDTGLSSHQRGFPILELAKVTVLLFEAFGLALIATPKLAAFATPDQVPLIALGIGCVLALGLDALIAQGARHACALRAYRGWVAEYARHPEGGSIRPRPVTWQDDQSVDDDRPRYEMGLARLQATGNATWPRLAVVAVVAVFAAATAVRYSTMQEAAAQEAAQSEQRSQVLQQASHQPSSLQRASLAWSQAAGEWTIGLLLLTLVLGAAISHIHAANRAPLGNGTADLLDLTRNCSSAAEEQAMLSRRIASAARVVCKLQRDMGPFARAGTPSVYDILQFLASSRSDPAQSSAGEPILGEEAPTPEAARPGQGVAALASVREGQGKAA